MSSIRTYALIAWVFSTIVTVVWIISFLYVGSVEYYLLANGFYEGFGEVSFAYLIILLVFLISSILVMMRARKLYSAAKRTDIQGLKKIDSVAWAVVALIFAGVIPGVMLLVAHGPVTELETAATGDKPVMGEDSISKLERLKTLLDDDVITQDEFEQQKRKILGPTARVNTPEDELRRLKQLLDSGAITKDEFEAQKKRILSKL